MDFETTFIILVMLIGFVAWKTVPRIVARVPFVEAGEVVQWLQKDEIGVVIDVRSHGEYIGEGGHIAGAINLPYGYIADRLKELSSELAALKDQPVLIAAGGDNLAAHSARLLRKAGFSNIAILKGGMKRWNSMALPVEKGLPPDSEIRMD